MLLAKLQTLFEIPPTPCGEKGCFSVSIQHSFRVHFNFCRLHFSRFYVSVEFSLVYLFICIPP